MTRSEDAAAAALDSAEGPQKEWRLLRIAIADALLEKLPALVPLSQLPELLGVPEKTVVRALDSGDLSAVTIGGVPHMVTADSFGFLSGDSYLRWPVLALGVSDPIPLDSMRALRADRQAEWSRLRGAIVEEMVQRLPSEVPLASIPRLLRVTVAAVADAVRDGKIAVTARSGVQCMVTAESRQFLEGVGLPLPQRMDPRHRPGAPTPLPRGR